MKKDHKWKNRVDSFRLRLVDILGNISEETVGGQNSQGNVNQLEAALKTLDGYIEDIADYGNYNRKFKVIEVEEE